MDNNICQSVIYLQQNYAPVLHLRSVTIEQSEVMHEKY